MSNPTTSSQLDSALLHFLEQPDSYPHKPESVEHVQTHISHVFLAPPFVYKLKKPVDFGFLDYSTLAKRNEFCQREVELNRRLCDDVYQGVVSIVEKDDGYAIEEETQSGNVVEYAVKMKQLEEKYFLHSYLKNDSLTREHLNRVSDKLTDFYNSQQSDDVILKWGEIENIKVNTDENFSQTNSFIGKTLDRNTFNAIRHFTNRYFEEHAALFERRIEERRIVDGHGDLHLEHIHITPEKVRIYDCIEFNERFRYGDLAVDLAFLAMDLDFNGCWQEERYFIDRMAKKLNDPDLLQIIDFYKCYRAYVKGKVKSLQSTEEEVPKKERQRAAQLAMRYFDLSLRYALLGSKPSALVFMGKVGTGKSTLARYLHEKFNIEYFSTDQIRKSLAGLPLEERTPASKRDELYSSKVSTKTYRILLDNAVSSLKAGKSVILDATFSTASSREKLTKRLSSLDADLLFIEAQAPNEVLRQRLKGRESQQGVISDARIEDFDKLEGRYAPPEELDSAHLIEIDTDRQPGDTIEQLYLEMAERNVTRLAVGREL